MLNTFFLFGIGTVCIMTLMHGLCSSLVCKAPKVMVMYYNYNVLLKQSLMDMRRLIDLF